MTIGSAQGQRGKTMRLIDADEIRWVDQYDADGNRSKYKVAYSDEMPPTVDAEPVRHGKWIWLSCTYDRVPREKEYECSECHHKTIVHGYDIPWEKYCPNCGARMDEDE